MAGPRKTINESLPDILNFYKNKWIMMTKYSERPYFGNYAI